MLETRAKMQTLGCKISILVFLLPLVIMQAALAQSTRSTEEQPLSRDLPAGSEFKLPDIRIKQTMTVDRKTGKVRKKAMFRSTGTKNRKFLFCEMVGLSATRFPGETTTVTSQVFIKKVGNQLQCERRDSTATFQKGFHFGCKVVEVPAGGTVMVDFGEHMASVFCGHDAWDFEVSYADMIDLSSGLNITEDALRACEALGAFGEGKYTNIDGLVPNEASGAWILKNLPIKDPFIRSQPLEGPPGPEEYAPFAQGFSVPSDFPASVPDLSIGQPDAVPPDIFTVDLNLFDLFTMQSMSPSDASLKINTTPSLPELSFSTDPPPMQPFTIPPRDELFGQLNVESPLPIPEGQQVDVAIRVDTNNPEFGRAFFEQQGTFVNDTVPPLVLSHSVQPVLGGKIAAEITASDETTSPIAANLWVSDDDGASWQRMDMDSTSDLLQRIQTRTFTAQAGPFLPGTQLQYFFTVQDEVFNVVFFGVGQIEVP